MDVKLNVKYKFKVNGKEYGSLEEMPAPIREAYEKAVANSKGINTEIFLSGKVVFNGQEYESVDSMPADIRQMYETIMKTVKSGEIPATANTGLDIGEKAADFRKEGDLDSYSISNPIAPKSSFSPVVLMIIVIMLALLAGLYLLIGLGFQIATDIENDNVNKFFIRIL